MRAWSTVVVVAVAALAAVSASGASAHRALPRRSSGSRRLNVVVILSDDERVDGTSVMHDVQSLLARHGVTFTNYHVTTSECGPSRASILTGQYSHHTGVTDNFGLHSYPAFNESSTVATWLQGAGYDTALVGKYINDYTIYGHHRIPPGWNDWQVMDSIPMERYYGYAINDNGHRQEYGYAPKDYSTTVLTNKAISFIRGATRPFFLYFAPVTPHLPAIPAPQDRNKLENIGPLHVPSITASIKDKPWSYWHKGLLTMAEQVYQGDVRRRQLQSLLSLDRSVARIVHTLKARHELNDTVILYTSDNGFLWGEHRLGGKIWPYEESTHVPLIVRTPWTTRATTNREPVLNIDLASTISQLAGVKPAGLQDGRSFVPLLHGVRVPWRKAYLVEYLGRNLLHTGGPPPYVAVHTARYLYVEYRRGWRELYDLRKDPWELDNVAGQPRYRKLQASLGSVLQRLWAQPPQPATA
ncbi:MAG TPA: sulfatase [Gaiellaceae bacterium]|nr:sulfatase [Gaiellaceae bacterium]